MRRRRPTRRRARGQLLVVLGGASSGKSAFALSLAVPPRRRRRPRAFIATAEALDREMAEKIRRHQGARGDAWATREIPTDVPGWLEKEGRRYAAIVLDCLTLWVSNLLGTGVGEPGVLERMARLVRAARGSGARVVLVSNELGLGLVPAEPASRRFRDLAGRVNQLAAEEADHVYFVVSGIPIKLK